MPSKRIQLTESKIKKAVVPPDKDEIRLPDSIVPGLVVRIYPTGSRSFAVSYRPYPGGRATNKRLFTLNSNDLNDARAEARIVLGDIAHGRDPQQERTEERRRTHATLSKLLAADGPHETHLQRSGFVNWRVAMSSLRRGLRPYLARDVKDLTRADIVSAINALTPGAATDLRKFARGFLNWTTAQGLTAHNVMAGLRMPGKTRAQRLLLEPKGRAPAMPRSSQCGARRSACRSARPLVRPSAECSAAWCNWRCYPACGAASLRGCSTTTS
jgi:hypothetical protein